MPIYDYACSACGHVTEVVHGINDSGPKFCPNCGAEGSMRKAFSSPAIVFKGSGWAKVDRRGSSGSKSAPTSPSGDASKSAEGSQATSGSGDRSASEAPTPSTTTAKSKDSSGGGPAASGSSTSGRSSSGSSGSKGD